LPIYLAIHDLYNKIVLINPISKDCHQKQMVTIHFFKRAKFASQQDMKAQRRSTGIAIPVFNLGTRWGQVVNASPRPLCSLEDPVPTVHEAGWAPGPV
jgi:hypothetical protein